MPDTMSNAMTVHQVAARLNCSVSTVRSIVKRGDLPAIRVGRRLIRVLPSSVADYESRIIGPAPPPDEPDTQVSVKQALAIARAQRLGRKLRGS